MAAIPKIVAVFRTTLSRRMSATDTTFTLSSVVDKTGNNIEGYYCFVIDEGTSAEEFILGTLVASTKVTGTLTRGLDYSSPTTAVPALYKKHDRGAVVKVTNYSSLGLIRDMVNGDTALPNKLSYDNDVTIDDDKDLATKKYIDDQNANYVATTGNETIGGVKTFSSSPIVPAPTTDMQAATKEYIDNIAISGAADASTTVKGIALLASTPASATSPVVLNQEEASLVGASSKLVRMGATAGTAAAGTVMVYNGSKWLNLGVGSDDEVLTSASGEASGLKWKSNAKEQFLPYAGTPDCQVTSLITKSENTSITTAKANATIAMFNPSTSKYESFNASGDISDISIVIDDSYMYFIYSEGWAGFSQITFKKLALSDTSQAAASISSRTKVSLDASHSGIAATPNGFAVTEDGVLYAGLAFHAATGDSGAFLVKCLADGTVSNIVEAQGDENSTTFSKMFYFSGYIYYFDDEATAYKKLDVSDDSISAGWGDIDTSFTYYFATLNNVYALDSNSKYIIIK